MEIEILTPFSSTTGKDNIVPHRPAHCPSPSKDSKSEILNKKNEKHVKQEKLHLTYDGPSQEISLGLLAVNATKLIGICCVVAQSACTYKAIGPW
jgi:hypothetical protein